MNIRKPKLFGHNTIHNTLIINIMKGKIHGKKRKRTAKGNKSRKYNKAYLYSIANYKEMKR